MKKVISSVLIILIISFIGIVGAQMGNQGQNNTENNSANNNSTNNNNATIDSNNQLSQNNSGENKTISNNIQNREKLTNRITNRINFMPLQKRNESECLEGCRCIGAVVSCPTENGKMMSITAGKSGKTITMTIDKTNTTTELELEQETNQNKTRLRVKLSNGEKAEIKIMPDTASKNALERLRLKVCNEENNCTIKLKETGKGENIKANYEMQIERHSKIFGIFQKKMQVRAEVNAENGNVEKVKKPW